MPTPPSGTVTFLFTDIEGSTKLAQQNPAHWEAIRARHHAILQRACDAHNGYVFQVIGDAFCVAFATAPDALAAAIEAQRALKATDDPVDAGRYGRRPEMEAQLSNDSHQAPVLRPPSSVGVR